MKTKLQQTRANFYTIIHKALRYQLYRFAIDLGKTDYSDDELPILNDAFNEIKETLIHHAVHEDKYLHPFMMKYLSKEVALIEADHQRHDSELATISKMMKSLLEEKQQTVRQILGAELYLCFNHFVANFIIHLHLEEFTIMPKLWPLCTDEQLMTIHHKLTSSMSQEELQHYGKLFMPAMNPQERRLLQG